LTFFNYLGQAITDIQTALAAAERVFAIMDEPSEPAMYLHLDSTGPQNSEAAIMMKHVDFGYRADDQVLQNLSLTIPKGIKVAIVGPSGQGKSTIIKLLMGFYPPKRGTILIDGQSIRVTELVELRKKIAYVPQNAYLFSGTIMENIRYGRMGATDEEVMEAARLANAHEFITDFEDGYQTYVGERGAQISGGQRQRIGIARAIVKNAPILMLDEATSALDAESELLVEDALHRLSGDRTIVLITHRFSAIKNVDTILVIADGRVTEQGTHEELIKHQGGIYQALYEQQYQNLQDIS
jgi:ATP-binding cassette subfamily B protein